MKIRVMYHSRSGNTKKLAEAIGKAVGVVEEAVPPAYPPENVNLLFLGTGIYYGDIDTKLKEYVRTLNPKRVKYAAVFGTMGNQDKGVKALQELLKTQGIIVLDEAYVCRGKTMIFFNRKNPTEKEISDAAEFAKRIVEKMEAKP